MPSPDLCTSWGRDDVAKLAGWLLGTCPRPDILVGSPGPEPWHLIIHFTVMRPLLTNRRDSQKAFWTLNEEEDIKDGIQDSQGRNEMSLWYITGRPINGRKHSVSNLAYIKNCFKNILLSTIFAIMKIYQGNNAKYFKDFNHTGFITKRFGKWPKCPTRT